MWLLISMDYKIFFLSGNFGEMQGPSKRFHITCLLTCKETRNMEAKNAKRRTCFSTVGEVKYIVYVS